MPTSYRSIIVAAVGWLALTAASPEHQAADRNQRYADNASAKALQNIASAIQQANERPEPDAGCKAGQDARNSDLCAQWKAADATWTSAVWTERTFWLGMLGTIIGAFTLTAAGFAAWYAREAARHTKAGADAADEAVRLAKVQDRPHLIIIEIGIERLQSYIDGAAELPIGFVNFKNFGSGPAWILHDACEFKFGYQPELDAVFKFVGKNSSVIPPGEKFVRNMQRAKLNITREIASDIINGTSAFIWGFVEYRGPRGEIYRNSYCVLCAYANGRMVGWTQIDIPGLTGYT